MAVTKRKPSRKQPGGDARHCLYSDSASGDGPNGSA